MEKDDLTPQEDLSARNFKACQTYGRIIRRLPEMMGVIDGRHTFLLRFSWRRALERQGYLNSVGDSQDTSEVPVAIRFDDREEAEYGQFVQDIDVLERQFVRSTYTPADRPPLGTSLLEMQQKEQALMDAIPLTRAGKRQSLVYRARLEIDLSGKAEKEPIREMGGSGAGEPEFDNDTSVLQYIRMHTENEDAYQAFKKNMLLLRSGMEAVPRAATTAESLGDTTTTQAPFIPGATELPLLHSPREIAQDMPPPVSSFDVWEIPTWVGVLAAIRPDTPAEDEAGLPCWYLSARSITSSAKTPPAAEKPGKSEDDTNFNIAADYIPTKRSWSRSIGRWIGKRLRRAKQQLFCCMKSSED